MPTFWRSCVQSRASAPARRDTRSCHTGSESAPSRPRSERCDNGPRRPHGGNRLGIRTLRSLLSLPAENQVNRIEAPRAKSDVNDRVESS